MISLKKLISTARKWKKIAGIGKRRRTSSLQKSSNIASAIKGHFVVYSADNRRFVVPLPYLSSDVFKQLFRMSEEEFGLPSNGPITLPCDALFMECVICVVQSNFPKELQRALLVLLASALFFSDSAFVCEELRRHQKLFQEF